MTQVHLYLPLLLRFIYPTASGVLCVDIHPDHPHLLAVGLYDGGVCVFNIRQAAGSGPEFRSTAETGKHTDPVWQVHKHTYTHMHTHTHTHAHTK